jgi:hypothetical protein
MDKRHLAEIVIIGLMALAVVMLVPSVLKLGLWLAQ